jgi:hypothetical protein
METKGRRSTLFTHILTAVRKVFNKLRTDLFCSIDVAGEGSEITQPPLGTLFSFHLELDVRWSHADEIVQKDAD